MVNLTVRRDTGWVDKGRKYRILLDGVEIGQLDEGAALHKQITTGPHVIVATIDWCGSQPLRIEAQSDDAVVVVRSALRNWRMFFAIFYVIFNRRGYLILEPSDQS